MKLNREETMNKSNHDQLISSVMDGEMSESQLDELLIRLKGENSGQIKKSWAQYHEFGDILRTDDLAVTFSPEFSSKFEALLAVEPIVFAPENSLNKQDKSSKAGTRKSAYWAITSVAATVMLGFLMAPQIIPLLNHGGVSDMSVTKIEQADSFAASGVKLASNANSSASASVNVNPNKDAEFASKLENQVEMLRDPRLDSYLLAHQKVSPSFDNGARYIQRANVVSSPDSKK